MLQYPTFLRASKKFKTQHGNQQKFVIQAFRPDMQPSVARYTTCDLNNGPFNNATGLIHFNALLVCYSNPTSQDKFEYLTSLLIF